MLLRFTKCIPTVAVDGPWKRQHSTKERAETGGRESSTFISVSLSFVSLVRILVRSTYIRSTEGRERFG